MLNDLNIFDTKDAKAVRTQVSEFLAKEQKSGYVEVTRDDDFILSNGVPVDVIQAKIAKGKRCKFVLHYGAFMLQGKQLSLSYNMLSIDNSSVFLDQMDLHGLDNISLAVEY